MESDYIKIYSGNALIGKRIELELLDLRITPVIKDEGESARLAGFASSMLGDIDIYVNQDEKEKATEIVAKITSENS
jgi:hypothetical protein